MILYVAASLHVFSHITIHLKKKSAPLLHQIEKWTVLCTIDYIRWAESQKETHVRCPHIAKFNFNRTLFSFLHFNSS